MAENPQTANSRRLFRNYMIPSAALLAAAGSLGTAQAAYYLQPVQETIVEAAKNFGIIGGIAMLVPAVIYGYRAFRQ